MGIATSDIISLHDLRREDIIEILQAAENIEENPRRLLEGKVLGTLFYEPSTRTRLSFDTAMQRLGGRVVGFADAKTSSDAKGESIKDTVLVVGGYADVIAMRHPLDGAARLAAKYSEVPIINAGDGSNQHPTQTLLDLYTIQKAHGVLDGLRVALVGDLKYGRTVHSLATALTHFDATIDLVAPEQLQMPEHLCAELTAAGVKWNKTADLENVIPTADVIYMTRIQRERFADPEEYEEVAGTYVLTASMLENAKPEMRILHPLPRVDEISQDVDDTPHAVYFEQAANGVPIRQALICLALGVKP